MALRSAVIALAVLAPAGALATQGGAVPQDDAALLQAMRADHVALTGERAHAQKILLELKAVHYEDQLTAREKAGAPDAAASRSRVLRAWQGVVDALTRPPTIDTRLACRSQERVLREALNGAPGSAAESRVPAARYDARACYKVLSRALADVRVANREMDAALAEARALLAAPVAAAGAGSDAPAPASAPVPAAEATR